MARNIQKNRRPDGHIVRGPEQIHRHIVSDDGELIADVWSDSDNINHARPIRSAMRGRSPPSRRCCGRSRP